MSEPLKVFVTGGTGLVGRPLLADLASMRVQGAVLTRDKTRAQKNSLPQGFVTVEGDISEPSWVSSLKGHDVVVHLAGYPLFEKRWSGEVKKLIRDSRVQGTKVLAQGIRSLAAPERPRRVLCASAVGYYGTSSTEEFTESSPAGDDFLAQVAVEWEQASRLLEGEVEELSIFRLGIVLSPEGGMLARVLPIFKAGLGGKIATGGQWISWVHHHDVREVLKKCILGPGFAAPSSSSSSVYNLCAPHPVTNKEFTQALAQLLARPSFFKVPQLFLQTLLGEGSHYLVRGQKVKPSALLEHGHTFTYPELGPALEHLLKEGK